MAGRPSAGCARFGEHLVDSAVTVDFSSTPMTRAATRPWVSNATPTDTAFAGWP